MSDNINDIIDRRAALYGDPVESYIRIAKVWSGIIGHEVQPCEVPLMMAGLKLVRTQVTPDYSGSSDDVDGYMFIFRQMVGDDMVHAETPAEYWAQKDEWAERVRAAKTDDGLCRGMLTGGAPCTLMRGHQGVCH